MRISDPGKLALINALGITLLFLALMMLLSFWYPLAGRFILISTLVLFTISYLLIRITAKRFLDEKIKIIYKIIRRQKAPRGKKKQESVLLERVEKEAERWTEENQREIEELKQMAQYRREFLGNVSHELKTPIFNIQGYILTLLEGGLEDKAINREYLLRTERSINRMIALVEDLESISKLETGETHLQYTSFDMLVLTHEVLELLESKASRKELRIEMIAPGGKPVMVLADRDKIQQVLVNLIDNSIKYCNRGGHVKVSFFEMEDQLLVEVADNGIGVEEPNIPRLFERFYRTDKARSREEGGSGLGLAIVKHIVEAHGQQVHVRSSVGIGTTIGFSLQKNG